MDGIIAYALAKKLAGSSASGVKNVYKNGTDLIFEMMDGNSFTVDLSDLVNDYADDITDVELFGNNLKLTYGDKSIKEIDLSKFLDARDFSKNPLNLQTEVTGKLQSANIGDDVARKTDLHTHDNMSILSEIGESSNGQFTYKGIVIDGENGKNLEFKWNGTSLGVRVEGDTEYIYTELRGSDGEDGEAGLDGREIELSKSDTHIQWRYAGRPTDTGWTKLVALEDLRGRDGNGVRSVNGKDGDILLSKDDVGLTNVTNDKQATKVEFDNHKKDSSHIKEEERTKWNNKMDVIQKANTSDVENPVDDSKYTTPLIVKQIIDRFASASGGGIEGAVESVNGKTGHVTLTKDEIGLTNVTNDKQATKVEFDNHTGDASLHITQADRDKIDNIVDTDFVREELEKKTSNVDFTEHKNDGNIHVTKAKTALWDAKLGVENKADETDIANPTNDSKYMTPAMTKQLVDKYTTGGNVEWNDF